MTGPNDPTSSVTTLGICALNDRGFASKQPRQVVEGETTIG